MIEVGVAGWSYPDWRGRVYPRGMKRGDSSLAYLARYLECMELNSSFYAYPSARNAEAWNRQLAGREFPFIAKVHRDFTHGEPESASHAHVERAAAAFLEGLVPLRESGRLRGLLLQFPVTFVRSRENRHHLDRLVHAFESDPLILELRHVSWFDPAVLERFAARELSVATIDLPASADHPPETHRTTGPIGYLRLHGRNATQWFRRGAGRDDRYDYCYSPSELDRLAEIARTLGKTHDSTYVITNNHFQGQAVANALELRARLSGVKPPAPQVLRQAFPRIADQTTEDGPGTLF